MRTFGEADRVEIGGFADTLKRLGISFGLIGTGAVVMYASRGRWPGMVAGVLIMGGGGYLTYREWAPPPKVPEPELTALYEYEGVVQPELGIVAT